MPRIFELRSCLQEVQDSILLAGDHEADVARHGGPGVSCGGGVRGSLLNSNMTSKDLWFEFSRQPHLGSEQDVINIPGKTKKPVFYQFFCPTNTSCGWMFSYLNGYLAKIVSGCQMLLMFLIQQGGVFIRIKYFYSAPNINNLEQKCYLYKNLDLAWPINIWRNGSFLS